MTTIDKIINIFTFLLKLVTFWKTEKPVLKKDGEH